MARKRKTTDTSPFAGMESIDDAENAYFSDAAGWTCENEHKLSGFNDRRVGNEDGRGPQRIQRLYLHRKSKKHVVLIETVFRGSPPSFKLFGEVELDDL